MQEIQGVIDFILDNKEWLFSGLGVAIGSGLLLLVLKAIFRKRKPTGGFPSVKETEASNEPVPEVLAKKRIAFCRLCGKLGGTYSSCLRGDPHEFNYHYGTPDEIYCSKCGKTAGEYSSCLRGDPHDFRVE